MTGTSRQNSFAVILAIVSLACVAFACRKVGGDLWLDWQKEEYSHGVIIPFISLLLAWHAMTAARPSVKPSWWGVLLLVISAGFLMTGTLAAFEMASEYGFILSLAALSLAFLGTQATWVMLPALIYLLFAVPLPHIVFMTLSQDLQLLSSTFGVFILDLADVPVFQQGNIIDLGGYQLQVAEACSGLRYLFPLMSFGFLVAYLLEDTMWKRAVVFLSSIPITIAMNSLRIALVGITVDRWGKQMAEGFLHEFEGWVIFILCVIILMTEVSLLLRVGTGGRFRFEYLGPARGPLVSGHMHIAGAPVIAFLLSLGMAGLFGSNIIEERAEICPPHLQFSGFPAVLGKWHGQQDSLEPDVLGGLQLSDYWLADYTKDGSVPVNFYMAYYASQRAGAATHSPALCIPGGGWQIVSREVKTVTLPYGVSVQLSRMLIRRGNVTQLVYYWFDERGRDITENTIAKWYLILDSIQMHRTDGALIRLVTQVTDSEDIAEKRLNDFLTVAYPEIKNFVPGPP